MPNITPIDDPADPRLAPYQNLKDRELARGDAGPPRLFLAESELVVRQLLASPIPVHSVLLNPTRLAAMRDAIAPLPASVPVYLAEQPVMDRATGFHFHRGVLAAGVRPDPPPLDALLARARTLVVLEHLANHDNVGGLFRAAAALGGLPRPESPQPAGAAILLSPGCCDPFYRKSIRVSIGTVLRVPFATLEPWPAALARVRAAGFAVWALTPDEDARDLAGLPVPERVALVLGAEGPGLGDAALAAADVRVRIAIDPRIDSLNVVTAASIALHHVAGRWHRAPGAGP